MKRISIVIPVLNEEENVEALHREIVGVCEENKYEFEIIFVDDGSTDQTYVKAKALSPVKVIRMRKNFGQTASFDAGIKEASMDYIITMDGDLQNDPADIPKMLAYMDEMDLDVVAGWRKNRKDSFLKKFVSRRANFLRSVLVKDHIHDSGCSLKVFKKECFEGITLYGEMHRFIPAILMKSGFRVGEVVVNHRARTHGVTKYNWKRTFKGFVDMISVAFWDRFSVRPLHLLGVIGLFFITLSFFAGCYTVYEYFQGQGMSETAWPVLTISFFLAGIQFFVSGLIIDVLMKNYYETTGDKPYSIREVVQNS